MVRLLFVIAQLVALAGCNTENSAFCANPANAGLQGCPGDATTGGTCSRSADCMGTGYPVCDTNLNMGTCVQCTDTVHDACVDKKPACVSDMCQPCTQHSQCPSRACQSDGSCADAAQVAYVRPTGTGTACTDAAPCKTINDGLKARSIVKVEGAIMDDMATVIDGKAVTILADTGSKLTRTMPGVTLDVRNDGADVQIFDLEITSGMGSKTDATISLSGGGTPKLTLTRATIDGNQGIGIIGTSGLLTVSRSTISANAGGGISIAGAQFDITNSFIIGNGGAAGAAATLQGGIAISQIDNGTRRFEFNTVARNNSAMNLVAGVNCNITQSATFANNIVYDNTSGTGKIQIGGNCVWNYSDIGDPSTTATAQGTLNINADPSYISPGSDYHLKPSSPARNAADPGATLQVDYDGDPRPQNSRSDMGADEVTGP